MKQKNKFFVISLGGSLVVPDAIDVGFLKKFHSLILSYVKRGYRFIIIVGGGKTARCYQKASKQISHLTTEDVDWLGIHATRLNAHLLRTIFRSVAYPKLITSKKDINTRIRSSVIIASGFRPGSSTDLRAVQLAHAYGTDTILNLSNIKWVYTKDPKKYKSAKKITSISWKDFRKIVGNTWDPGANTPFDPVASRYAEKWGMKVFITNGKDYANLIKILTHKKAKGTVISR